MRGLCLQFLLLFAVLCAGLHAPALAHDLHGEHGEDIIELSGGQHSHVQDTGSQDKSGDASQELFHHHHCPMAMSFENSAACDSGIVSRDVLRPGEAAALVSRTPPPLIEPPLA